MTSLALLQQGQRAKRETARYNIDESGLSEGGNRRERTRRERKRHFKGRIKKRKCENGDLCDRIESEE